MPEKMTITMSNTIEPARDHLTTHLHQKKAIPDTLNHNTTQKCLIPLPNMRRSEELMRTTKIKQRATRKATPSTKIRRNITPPSKNNSVPCAPASVWCC